MSSSFRCNSFHRLHRDSTTAEECQKRMIEGEEKAKAKAAGVTPTSFKTAPDSKAPVAKRGRGRPRKHPITPTPAPVLEPEEHSGDQLNNSSSPSTSHRSILPFRFGNLFTPNATQEDPMIIDSDQENSMPDRAPPPYALSRLPNNSPASTEVIPETVFNDSPGIGQPGPSNWYNPNSQRDSSMAPEVYIPTTTNNIEHSPVHWASSAELAHLLRSRGRLTEDLENTTGLIHRLQTRSQVHEANAMVNEAFLVQVQEEQKRLKHMVKGARWENTWLGWALRLLVVGILGYMGVCWWFAPEMEYVRKRRAEVFME